MSRDFPALVDLWQLARARRRFRGTWPIAKMSRLCPSLEATTGNVRFCIECSIDPFGIAVVDLAVNAQLTLLCQRTLEPFVFSIEREARLGLLASEAQEASLPGDYEPYLVPADAVRLVDLVEDELILALPVVARKPALAESSGVVPRCHPPPAVNNPFAVLAGLLPEEPRAKRGAPLVAARRSRGTDGE